MKTINILIKKTSIKWKATLYSLLGITVSACGVNIYSTNDDVKLGQQVVSSIETNPKEYPILNDPNMTNYVQGIVNKLLNAPEIKYRGKFAYTVKIIRDDKTINAFCTPGGYIYVYTGLMKMLDNEASLAAVLGHEVAHAELRHATDRMTKAYGAQALTSIILGNNPGQTAQIAANLFTNGGLLLNSRSDESQSDEYSFKYLRSTNWYPGAIKFFFEKISNGKKSSGFSASVERLFSTHPLPQDRIDETNKRISDSKIPVPTEAQLNSVEYKRIISRLP